MSRNFVACELGEEQGRIFWGTLHNGSLRLTPVRRFQNVPIVDRDGMFWDAAQLYQDLLVGLREVGGYDEPVESISCTAWPSDYLLFHSDASFIPPTYHYRDSRTAAGRQKLLAEVPWESLFEETGVHNTTHSTLFQLAVEKSKRLKKADHLLPVADGFNFLLSGVAGVEKSAASATQLYNPVTGTWSELLLGTLRLPAKLFPDVVAAGTKLKPLRAEIGKATKLEEPQIIASCSHELAATVMGLPVEGDESWVFLRLGGTSVMGTEHPETIRNGLSRETRWSNLIGYGNKALLHKQVVGLNILEECRQHWAGAGNGLEDGVITHLAASSPPLESFINLDDPRFAEPGDMPLKIRAYCKETNQPEPRKPGPVVRCVLESLALHYRQTLMELSLLTNRDFTHLFLLGDTSYTLLNHFIANALQIPLVIASPDTTAIGNLMVQALATGHLQSVTEARQVVRQSFKTTTISPYAVSWSAAYERFGELIATGAAPVPA